MKREQLGALLSAALLSFAISFGGAACVVTGFDMHNHLRFSGAVADLAVLGIFCALFSLICAGCLCLRRGGMLLLCFGGAATLWLWLTGPLELGMEALLYRLTATWQLAYNTPVISWTEQSPLENAPDLGICLLAAGAAAAAAWTVCRRKKAVLPVLLGLLMLLLCVAVTDTVPEGWCIFLLLAGIALLMLTNSVRRMNAREGARLTALLLVPVIVVTSVLFLAVPREGYQAQTEQMQQTILKMLEKLPFVQMDSQGNLGFGFGGTSYGSVNLATVGNKNTMPYAVMDVTAPTSGLIYLRGQALDVYNGKSWEPSSFSTGVDHGWMLSTTNPVGELKITTRAGQPMYFFPYYPDIGFMDQYGDFTDGYIANPHRQKSYTVNMVERTFGSADYGITGALRKQCLELPRDTRIAAQQILSQLGEPTAERIRAYVEKSAQYALQVGRMPEEESDFAIWFLEDADKGYCIHFATAAAVLLRAAGIPARYVTGYVAQVSAREKATVTADKSHAWVEYYEDGRGWTVLEATPADFIGAPDTEPDTTEPVTTQPDTTEPVTTRPEQTRPTEPSVTEPGQTLPTQPPADTTVPGGIGEGPGGKVDFSGLFAVLKVLLYIAAACAGVWGQYGLRRRIRKKKMHTGHPNARVLALWREVRRYCRILGKKPPERLLSLAEKAKFSQHTLSAGERLEFDGYLKECASALRQKKWYQAWLLRLVFAVE